MTVSWDRRVVPQWLRSTDPHLRFVRPLAPSSLAGLTPAIEETFARELREFARSPSVGLAADLLRFGFHPDLKNELAAPARMIIENGNAVPEALRRLATALTQDQLQGVSLLEQPRIAASSKAQISSLRKWLADHPKDALTWLDLGRLHASTGNLNSASKAVTTALALSPDSRTILRASSRFFLHAHEPDRALKLLDRSARTPQDPWLLAGHIAISSIVGKPSKYTKKAKLAVMSGRLSPRDLTELASSLATVELESGSNKDAKRLFAVALEDPNENSLAQAEWAGQRLNIELNLPPEWLDNPISSEANYYRLMLSEKLDDALNAAVRWHDDEPFASRPMLAASFISAISGRYLEAAQFARHGLVAEPNSIPLLNNLAFALGAAGEVLEAERQMTRVMHLEGGSHSGHTFANLGMIAYLRGEAELGDQLYEAAARTFKRDKEISEVAVAATFRAHFARTVGAPSANEAIAAAKEMAENSRSPIAISIFRLLIDAAVKDTAPAPKIAGPRKWHYDRSKNVLTFESFKPFG